MSCGRVNPHLARLEVGAAVASLKALDDIAAGLGVPVWVIAFESDYDAEAPEDSKRERHCFGEICVGSQRMGGCECACSTCWFTCCGFEKPEGEEAAEEVSPCAS